MKAALVALAMLVLLHAPEALARPPVWTDKTVRVLDYTTPMWDGLVAGMVEDFNVMLPDAAPRLVYRRLPERSCQELHIRTLVQSSSARCRRLPPTSPLPAASTRPMRARSTPAVARGSRPEPAEECGPGLFRVLPSMNMRSLRGRGRALVVRPVRHHLLEWRDVGDEQRDCIGAVVAQLAHDVGWKDRGVPSAQGELRAGRDLLGLLREGRPGARRSQDGNG